MTVCSVRLLWQIGKAIDRYLLWSIYVRTFRIEPFIENVVEFHAKIRISGGSSPRFGPLGTNAHFTHVFTYGALSGRFLRALTVKLLSPV